MTPPFRDITVGNLLTSLSRALPSQPALLYENGPRYTFAELEAEARLVARGLIAHGVQPGERVVVWATNVPEWIVLQFALAKAGAILVTANTSLTREGDRLPPAPERGRHHCRPSAAFGASTTSPRSKRSARHAAGSPASSGSCSSAVRR